STRPSPRAGSASTNTWRSSSRRGPRNASPSRANTIGATTCGCGPSRCSGRTRRSGSGSPLKSPFPSWDALDFPSSSTPPGYTPSPSWRRISSSTARPGTRPATPGLLRWGSGCRSTWPRRPSAPTRSPGRAPWPPCKASVIAWRTAPRVWEPPATGALRPNTSEAMSYDDWLRDKVVYGTPEKVVDRLQQLRDELDLTQILYEVNHGRQLPYALQLENLKLINERVIPQLK